MAVVDEKPKEKKFEQVLSITDLANPKLPTGSASKLDVDADAYEVPMPPPMGRYDLRVALAEKDPIKMKRIDDKDPSTTYYSVALECRIISDDETANNRAVYVYVSSRMARGQKISTLAYVLIKCGVAKEKLADKEMDQLTLVRAFVKWLASERVVKKCLIDWEGYSKEHSKTVFRSMNQFPLSEDGVTHEHVVTIAAPNGGVEEISAKLVLKDWGEKAGEEKSSGGGGPIPVRQTVSRAQVEAPDEEEGEEEAEVVEEKKVAPPPSKRTKATVGGGVMPQPAKSAPTEEDEDLDALFG